MTNTATRQDVNARAFRVRPDSVNEESRTVEVIASSQDRVTCRDPFSMRTIDEVLITRGVQIPDRVPLLDNHDRLNADGVIGSAFGIRSSGNELTATIQFAEGDDRAEKIWNKVRQGHINSVSAGYLPVDFVDIAPGQRRTVAGRDWSAERRTLRITTGWALQEISVVPFGADPRAMIRNRLMNDDLLNFLQSIGLRSDATDDQAQAFYDALGGAQRAQADEFIGQRSEETEVDDEQVGEQVTSTAAQRSAVQDSVGADVNESGSASDGDASAAPVAQRSFVDHYNAIRSLAGDDIPQEMVDRAIRESWTTERASTEFLGYVRDNRGEPVNHGSGPAIHTQQRDAQSSLRGMQAALMVRSGLDLENAHWAATPAAAALRLPEWLRAASSRMASEQHRDVSYRYMELGERYRTYSLFDICREGLRLAGRNVPHDRYEAIRSAVSTADVQNIFTTNVGAQLLASYESAPDTTGGWVREADVTNFQTQERPRLGKSSALEKLPRGDTAKHTTISDQLESYKIARYARQFVVDEQDIIDDRFDALRDMPTEMGEAARQLRPDLVYSILLRNPTLNADSTAIFHANHNNLRTGAALAAGTLKTAITDMGVQQEDGRNLGIVPQALLVPMGLKHTASELVNSATMFFTGGTQDRGTRNPLIDENLSVISDSRLDNGVTDPDTLTVSSGSGTTWFIVARSGRHTIEVGYLTGTGRAPQVRPFTLDRGQWGIGWDIKMDIGAKALDFRGLHKNTA